MYYAILILLIQTLAYLAPFTDVPLDDQLDLIYSFQAIIADEVQGMETCTAATTNCQSTNAEIVALSQSLVKGKTKLQGAIDIFKYVQSHIVYEGYSNTRYGAITCLKDKKGNCCDHAHVVNALMRASGYAAYYRHGTCHFITSGMTEGHVWSEVLVEGKWYIADTTSIKNSFGEVHSWTLVSDKGSYCTLPF